MGNDLIYRAFSNINSMLHNNMATCIFFWCQRLVASAIGKHTDEKERKHVISTLTNQKIFYFSLSAFLFFLIFFSRNDVSRQRSREAEGGGIPSVSISGRVSS